VCICLSPCYPCFSLTGGSSHVSGLPKRKHRFIPNEEGVLVDEVAIRQHKRLAAKKAEKEKLGKAQARRKGKATRPNYKTMPEPDYILVRRNDWYATPHDEELEDRGFWCEEQWFIFHDIYASLKNPTRPMHAIDLPHLCSETYFDDDVSVIEKLGLTELAVLKCNFNLHLIMQFYATLVIMPNVQKTMKWMLLMGTIQWVAVFTLRVQSLKRISSMISMNPLVSLAFSMVCFHSMISLFASSERTLPLVAVTMMPSTPLLSTFFSLPMSVLLLAIRMRISL
jgi:hypothetical protein